MTYLIPLGLTAIALTVTYFTCIRPMRAGQGSRSASGPAGEPAIDAEVRRLREEVQLLQHELDLRSPGPRPQEQRSQ